LGAGRRAQSSAALGHQGSRQSRPRVGVIEPMKILTKREVLSGAIEAYEQFDKRMPGWIKTELNPEA
jgi:threonine dehydrogenase-like Zn-dependent dehydrogenase